MHKPVTLTLDENISIIVPDSLELISCYVLREQGDWFEDELRFIRKLLKKDQKCIDIGANYGVFSLSLAKIVGSGGAIYAFEPASETRSYLSKSIELNNFTQIVLDHRGLSETEGDAQLSLNPNSELNEIARHGKATDKVETIRLTSLDIAMHQYGWHGIDFVKIDAEGEEEAILKGGSSFFATESPLVQYEVKAGSRLNLNLVKAFGNMGYQSYRLVPGLDLLVPFNPESLVDGFLLNLFCCKEPLARQLSRRGYLVTNEEEADQSITDSTLLREYAQSGFTNALERLRHLPYGKFFWTQWERTLAKRQSTAVCEAISLHTIAHSKGIPAAHRYKCLQLSLKKVIAICNQAPTFLRTLTLGRLAREFGARSLAIQALESLVKSATSGVQLSAAEPFLAANSYFDFVDPTKSPGNWVVGSAMEELERSSTFSSYFSDQSARDRLMVIQQLGFGTPEMSRRLSLLNERYGR